MKNLKQQLSEIIKDSTQPKSLLINSCCAPCSSSVLEFLSAHFNITLIYYNPNIVDVIEHNLRLSEQLRLLDEMPFSSAITFRETPFEPQVFLTAVKGLEGEPEGAKRCTVCFRLRMEKAARLAKDLGLDYFTTTLSVSPHKNSLLLDGIATVLAEEYSVNRLPSDFKKNDGYKRSIQLSEKYSLYRQNWCGCPFSKERAGVNI